MSIHQKVFFCIWMRMKENVLQEKTSKQFNVSFRAAEIRLEVRKYIEQNNQTESYYKWNGIPYR